MSYKYKYMYTETQKLHFNYHVFTDDINKLI